MAAVFARHSIKVKVTLATVAIFLVGLWSLALYANRLLRMDLRRLLSDQQAASVSLVAANINAQVRERLDALESIAIQVGPVLTGPPARLQTLLEERPILPILFNSGTFITGTEGTAIAAIPRSMGRQGVNYLVRDAVVAALAGQVSVGGLAMGIRAQAPIFVMGVPLRDTRGKIIGALAGVTNLAQANFLDALTQGGYGKTGGYLLALPKSREILTATDKRRIMETLPAPGVIPATDRFLQGFEGSAIFINRFGIERLASAKGIPAAGWVLIAELPTEEAFAPLQKLERSLWLATLLLTGLAGGVTWWVVKRQLAPMLAAAKAMAALARDAEGWRPLPISHPDEIGDMVGGFNFLLDTLAQRQHALAESEQNYHQLQKAESLGRMAGSIAHHFNNKLQAVIGNLELISELPQGTDPAPFLAMAKQGAEKAAEVSRLMLTYLGQTALKREPCRLAERCRAALPLLQNALPSTIILETEFPSPGPVVSANAEQLQQLLANLLTNAGEAMAERGGAVQLRLWTCLARELPMADRFPYGWQPDQMEYACLEVADTGCGINGADFDKLFDPFFSTKFVGRGLGLPVVLGIVQAHGGAIAVTSQPGQGSAFRVYFPVVTEAVPELPEPRVPGLSPDGAAPEGEGTLLLVDDDPMLLETTRVMVEMLGFTVLTAHDGVAALEVFQQHRAEIRLVISDLTMPRLDGWGTLAALRRLDPDLPVILASGHDKAQVLAGNFPDRPQAFLSKPFGLAQLREALGQALRGGPNGL